MKVAVVRTGGKQYMVRENDEIVVDQLADQAKKEVELDTLVIFDTDKDDFQLGYPLTKTKVKAKVEDNLKGEKIRVARFKAKVRYRKVKGFRARLMKIKIIKI